jgi:hypothetical protein
MWSVHYQSLDHSQVYTQVTITILHVTLTVAYKTLCKQLSGPWASLTKHNAMKTYGRVEVHLHHSLTRHKMVVRSQLLAPVASPPEETALGTNFKRGWVGLRAGLNSAV